MTYPLPDAYRRPAPPALIPWEGEVPAEPWGWRKFAAAGLSLAGIGLGWKALKLPYSGTVRYLDLGVAEAGVTWQELVGGRLQWRDYLLNLIKAFEEETPFHLGRTFGLSELLSPYVLGERARLDIPAAVLERHRQYYEALLGRPDLPFRVQDYEKLRLEGGRLYGITQTGERQELLGYARLRLSRWQPAVPPGMEYPAFRGRLSEATQEVLARSRGLDRLRLIPRDDSFPFQVVGSARAGYGQIPWRHYLREVQSVAELWNRRFFRLLDNPLELFADLGVQAQDIPGVYRIGSWLQRTGLVNRFGLGGDYSGNVLRQWGRWLLPGRTVQGGFRPGALLTFVGLPFAYRALDQYFRDHEAFRGTLLEHGLSGAAASLWQRAMLARARFGQATGLSALARAQERVAPGSTDLGVLLGLPLAMGVGGGLYGFARTRFWRAENLGDVWRQIKLPVHSFTGSLGRLFRGKYTYSGKMIRGGLALGALLEAPFLLGAAARLLGGLRTPEELERIYRGEEEVPVRKGRWWEMGSTFYKGEKVEYFRPHWTVLAKSGYLDKALFRGDEPWWFKAAKRTPILTDIVAPYYLETLHYYDRPYPLAGPSYPGLGIVGPIYAATLGRLLKPVRTMHEEEWRLPGGVKYQPEEHPPVLELGGLPPAPPESPYSLKRTAAEAWHRWTEAIGLPGWLLRLGLGSEKWGAGGLQYASAERMVSEERQYWDANLGGLMGGTEWYRRINVRRRTAIGQQQYNPLRNRMPSWLPGPEYFIDFKSGDPFLKISRGEARLPGPGYAALHPELQGVHPEDYPLLHRLKILADVAPYAEQTRRHLELAQSLKRAGRLTEAEAAKLADVKRQLAAVKRRKEFAEYRDWSREPFPARGPGRYWELLTHKAERAAVGETLLPFRPLAKFVHRRDPLEDYRHSVIFGADQGFWNRPWANFVRPTLERIGFLAGEREVPRHVRRQRELEEYFDKLKYLKARLHARRAEAAGDLEAAAAWRAESRKTLTGAEVPRSAEDYAALLSALPKRERDYFEAFSREEDPERQAEILAAVPAEVGRLYRLLWEQRALGRLRDAEAGGALEGKEKQVKELKAALLTDLRAEGRATPELLRQYREEKPGVPLDEWLRERELAAFFQERPLPPPDSLVWDPRVDLEDVKLKVVQNQGQDFHDYDLWEARERTLPRKPYLEEAVRDLRAERNPEEVRRQVHAMCRGLGLKDFEVRVRPAFSPAEVQVRIVRDPRSQLEKYLTVAEHGDRRPRRRPVPSVRRQRRKRNERPL